LLADTQTVVTERFDFRPRYQNAVAVAFLAIVLAYATVRLFI
jgi:hypothetical protein